MRSTVSLSAVALILLCASSPQAQNQKPPKTQEERIDLKGFRTEGGLTNIVEGPALYLHGKDAPQTLTPQKALDDRDAIQVGKNGRVEVLLNPTMYLRLSANTEMSFLDLSPDNLKLKLSKGSAILEILVVPYEPKHPSYNTLRSQFNASYQSVTVATPAGDFVTATGGIYRCDVSDGGHTVLKVFRGEAAITGNLVGPGMESVLGDRVPFVKRLNKDRQDAFDNWSHERALALIASNKSLRNTEWHTKLRKDIRTSLEIKYQESSERLKERLTVTAIGGYVGYVENNVGYQSGDAVWQALNEGAALKYGDRVRTGPDSRAEINIYPTCYLTLASDTEILYGTRRDGGASIKVLKGSAIIASTLTRKDASTISFVAPEAEIELPGGGFYRLNVKPHRESELLVYEGTINLAGREIDHNHRVIFQGEAYDIWPIRRMDMDPFELWSRKRSSLLYEPQQKSRNNQTITPSAIAHRVEWTGMWYLDEVAGAYTFVPGGREFSSPYGGRYPIGFAGMFHR
jgi:hypothetical protein